MKDESNNISELTKKFIDISKSNFNRHLYIENQKIADAVVVGGTLSYFNIWQTKFSYIIPIRDLIKCVEDVDYLGTYLDVIVQKVFDEYFDRELIYLNHQKRIVPIEDIFNIDELLLKANKLASLHDVWAKDLTSRISILATPHDMCRMLDSNDNSFQLYDNINKRIPEFRGFKVIPNSRLEQTMIACTVRNVEEYG